MTPLPACPQCGWTSAEEDFCPRDGARLAAASPVQAKQALPEVPGVDAGKTATDARPVYQVSGPPDASSESGDAQKESRLKQVLRRLGVRKAPPAGEAAPDEHPSFLPSEVRDMGWRITGAVKSRGGIDRWPVERRAPDGSVVAGRLLRYRTGSFTPAEVYARIENGNVPLLVRVWQHGTTDFEGARADYEVGTLTRSGRSLARFLREGAPSEARALRLVAPLAALVRQLDAAGLRPLVLEPRWLHFTQDSELWLSMAGALAAAGQAARFQPAADQSPLLPGQWTAPELTQTCTMSESAPVFSAGQILAQAAWGEPCTLEEVRTGALRFNALADERLARILMGCLWPRADQRWQPGDLARAAAAASAAEMPAVPPWASLTSGAASNAFALAGDLFWRLEDLLTAAVRPAQWEEAVVRIDDILAWAEGTAWAGQARLLRSARIAGRSSEWVFVALVRAVRPALPLTWRGVDFSDEAADASLAALAQRVLEGSAADEKAIHQLIDADLRGAYAQGQAGPKDEHEERH